MQGERSIKEEVRQAPDWMNLKDGELYVDKDGVLFVADLQKFHNEQGVAPPNIFDKVQEDSHTIIFGEDHDSSTPSSSTTGTSGAPNAAPSLVPTVNDPAGTIRLHSSSSLDASSHDSTVTTDSTSANDDIIIRQSGPVAGTGTSAQCDNDDTVAQEGEASRQGQQEPGTPLYYYVRQPVVQSEDSLSDNTDSRYDSDGEYSVHVNNIHHFTKESEHPSSHQEHYSPEKNVENESYKKDEL